MKTKLGLLTADGTAPCSGGEARPALPAPRSDLSHEACLLLQIWNEVMSGKPQTPQSPSKCQKQAHQNPKDQTPNGRYSCFSFVKARVQKTHDALGIRVTRDMGRHHQERQIVLFRRHIPAPEGCLACERCLLLPEGASREPRNARSPRRRRHYSHRGRHFLPLRAPP